MKNMTWLLAILFHSLSFASINGAGSSFAYPLYSKWFSEYQKSNKNIVFNYQPIGSGGGVRQVIAQTVDFAGSDVPLTDENLKAAKTAMLEFPIAIGAVVVSYNLPEVKGELKIDGPTLALIFQGKITKWNDAKIKAFNPNAALPDQTILVVRRADASGTTAVFTDYLSQVSSDWKNTIGTEKTVNWPIGIGAKGNDGVTNNIQSMKYSIGYIELAYALNNKLSYFTLKNKENEFVKPEIANVTAASVAAGKALAKSTGNALTYNIVNADGKKSYPIASFTYMIIPKIEGENFKALKAFSLWAMDKGQAMAQSLFFAPLPKDVANLVKKKVSEF